jgi:hypothetical protein
LVKWLFTGLKLAIPVVMLSIVADPISTYQLKDFKGLSYLPKRILKPSEVKREVFRILGIKEAQP